MARSTRFAKLREPAKLAMVRSLFPTLNRSFVFVRAKLVQKRSNRLLFVHEFKNADFCNCACGCRFFFSSSAARWRAEETSCTSSCRPIQMASQGLLVFYSTFSESKMRRRFVLSVADCRITLRLFVSPPGFRFRSVGRLVGFTALYEFHGGFARKLIQFH